ncbi:hypothetical protein Taro_024992 [Colocasia esculenta]|uniref:Uncharacterized protein n=1 Tax=Colocasia esculenta TaxID=4460 RepID=A0A843V7R0_COLES|nr:hypothetical protein [Colocasia esculenta]
MQSLISRYKVFVVIEIGGDIRAWDRAIWCKSIKDRGDWQRRRRPFGLAIGRRAISLVLL